MPLQSQLHGQRQPRPQADNVLIENRAHRQSRASGWPPQTHVPQESGPEAAKQPVEREPSCVMRMCVCFASCLVGARAAC